MNFISDTLLTSVVTLIKTLPLGLVKQEGANILSMLENKAHCAPLTEDLLKVVSSKLKQQLGSVVPSASQNPPIE